MDFPFAFGKPVRGAHYDMELVLEPDNPASELKRQLLRAVLGEANRLASQHDFLLLVLIQPAAIDMTSNFWAVDYEYLSRYEQYSPRTLTSLAADLCRELTLDCLDLYDVFVANEPSTLFFQGGDSHWNDRGQWVAAGAAAAQLEIMLMQRKDSEAVEGPSPMASGSLERDSLNVNRAGDAARRNW